MSSSSTSGPGTDRRSLSIIRRRTHSRRFCVQTEALWGPYLKGLGRDAANATDSSMERSPAGLS